MNHETLMDITKNMPMKTIMVNGLPYLERYFAGYTPTGQHWLHRFVRSDSERHLHTHPWEGRAMVLVGGYKEQSRGPSATSSANDSMRYYRVGDFNLIFPETLHRIVEVQPDTWTLLHVKAGRQPTWKFIGDDGSETIMPVSSEDWHLQCGVRHD